jgi:hypothetical protein
MKQNGNHIKIYDPTGRMIVGILPIRTRDIGRAELNVLAQLRHAGYDV